MASSSADFSSTTPPERAGPYEILVPIASGGMATVFLARHHGVGGFEREVAVKFMHPHLRDDPAWEVEFLEEAKLAARVRHPNIVHTIDVGTSPHGTYLVMDYVEGDSLAGLVRSAASTTPLPHRIGLRILCDALSGLQAAHDLRGDDGVLLGLVHRDFSPQNILVGIDGTTRLTDFGVAKASSRTTFTQTGMIKGKAAYMAPEQLRAQSLDRRCDVWAAGVVAWEILAGRRLFGRGEEFAVGLRVLTETPPALTTLDASLSSDLEKAVATALVSDPSGRCPTAGELRRRLLDAADVATSEDVAAYVAENAEAKLEERQLRLKDVIRSRSVSSATRPPPAVDLAREEAVTVVSGAARKWEAEQAARASHRGRWIASGGAVIILAAFALLEKKSQTSAREQTPAPLPSSIALTASPSASASAMNSEGALLAIAANAPIAELTLGSREIVLHQAQSAVAIETTSEERAGDVSIAATSVDGRHATTHLAPDVRELTLTFAPAMPPKSTHSQRASFAPASTRPALAKDPYAR